MAKKVKMIEEKGDNGVQKGGEITAKMPKREQNVKKKGKVPKQILARASVQKLAQVMGILQAHKQNT
jgi:hypothetical protein